MTVRVKIPRDRFWRGVQMTRTINILLVSVFLIAGLGASASRDDETGHASVHLVPVYIYGQELQAELQVEMFRAADGGRDFSSRFHNNIATRIPYGTYIARVRAQGFWSSEHLVRVAQPTTTAIFALEVGREGGIQSSDLRGEVKLGKGSLRKSTWVRLFGVYSGELIDTEADETGRFLFTNVSYGDYLATAIQGERIYSPTLVKVPTASELVLSLNEATK
jgi:hypothetical protein